MWDIHNDLIGGEAGIISLEPVKRMRELAAIAKNDRGLESALVNGSLAKINQHIERNARFRREYHVYVERFRDRCLDELKLESQTLADDPLPMLRAVGQLSRVDNSASGGLEAMRVDAERYAFRNPALRS